MRFVENDCNWLCFCCLYIILKILWIVVFSSDLLPRTRERDIGLYIWSTEPDGNFRKRNRKS